MAKQPFYVEMEREGCQHCSAGRQWEVYGPDDVGIGGMTFDDREEAEHLAELLNDAHGMGLALWPLRANLSKPCTACEGVGNGSVHGIEGDCSACNGTGHVSTPPEEQAVRAVVKVLDEIPENYDWNSDPFYLTLLEGVLLRFKRFQLDAHGATALDDFDQCRQILAADMTVEGGFPIPKQPLLPVASCLYEAIQELRRLRSVVAECGSE